MANLLKQLQRTLFPAEPKKQTADPHSPQDGTGEDTPTALPEAPAEDADAAPEGQPETRTLETDDPQSDVLPPPDAPPPRIPPARLDEYNYFDFADLDFAMLERLFERSARFWRDEAATPEQMYWSVITQEEYKTELSASEIRAFLETGRPGIHDIRAIFETFWAGDGAPLVLDYGCGVGRLAVHAYSMARELHYADFSPSHLAEAGKNIRDFAGGTAHPHLLSDLGSLDGLPNCDLIYSLITLQHNTPPVIEHIVDRLLRALQPGGIAVLHVPLAIHGYSFDPHRYLDDPEAGQQLEMHILPKNNLNDLAQRTGCDVVASYGKGGTGDFYSEWIVYRKRG